MQTTVRRLLVLGAGFAVWSCGSDASTSGSDASGGSGGSANSTGGGPTGGASTGGANSGGPAGGVAGTGATDTGGTSTGGTSTGGTSTGGTSTGGTSMGGRGSTDTGGTGGATSTGGSSAGGMAGSGGSSGTTNTGGSTGASGNAGATGGGTAGTGGTGGSHPSNAASFGGHFYLLYAASVSGDEGEAACEALGGYLVCIESSEEQTFVAALAGSSRPWIGLNNKASVNDYVWVNGSPVTYQNWQPNQPDNPTTERWVKINADGTWDDAALPSAYICEWDR